MFQIKIMEKIQQNVNAFVFGRWRDARVFSCFSLCAIFYKEHALIIEMDFGFKNQTSYFNNQISSLLSVSIINSKTNGIQLLFLNLCFI